MNQPELASVKTSRTVQKRKIRRVSEGSRTGRLLQQRAHPVSRSGRFTSGPAADAAQFSESISFDWRLWKQDIRGSIAQATMLGRLGVITCRVVRHCQRSREIGRIADGTFHWRQDSKMLT
jgi:hypothetical protein